MATLAIIGGGGSKDSAPMKDDAGGDDGEKMDATAAREKASRALIKAVKNNDPQAVDDALYAHWKACEQDEPEDY